MTPHQANKTRATPPLTLGTHLRLNARTASGPSTLLKARCAAICPDAIRWTWATGRAPVPRLRTASPTRPPLAPPCERRGPQQGGHDLLGHGWPREAGDRFFYHSFLRLKRLHLPLEAAVRLFQCPLVAIPRNGFCPFWTKCWPHCQSMRPAMPKARATWLIRFPLVCARRTASRVNAAVKVRWGCALFPPLRRCSQLWRRSASGSTSLTHFPTFDSRSTS